MNKLCNGKTILYTPDMSGSGQFGICGKCGKEPTKEGHDGCIGTLPEEIVMNACCGHGDASYAYVQFWNKPTIRGDAAIEEISKLQYFNINLDTNATSTL